VNEVKEKEMSYQNTGNYMGDKSESAGKPQSFGSDSVGVGNIEKIRDILFGAQMRDFEKMFARLELRMSKETNDLRDEVRKRFESLENYINKEMESLNDRLKSEQNDRTDSIKELSKELGNTAKSLEKKIGQIDDQLNKSSRDLRQQILDQSKNLSDEIRQKHEEGMRALEHSAQELRTDKIDRAALSKLLMEMAMRITNDKALQLNLDMEE